MATSRRNIPANTSSAHELFEKGSIESCERHRFEVDRRRASKMISRSCDARKLAIPTSSGFGDISLFLKTQM